MEPEEFWAQIIQLTAVMALTLVLEVRAMYKRVQSLDRARTLLPRVAIATMYGCAVMGMLFTFVTALNGMAGAETPQRDAELVSVSLVGTFLVLVVGPTIPLIQGLVDDLPLSPDWIKGWKLERTRAQLRRDFEQADRTVRWDRLARLKEASAIVLAADESNVDDAMAKFDAVPRAAQHLEDAKEEIGLLLSILERGDDFTSDEVHRWRTAYLVVLNPLVGASA